MTKLPADFDKRRVKNYAHRVMTPEAVEWMSENHRVMTPKQMASYLGFSSNIVNVYMRKYNLSCLKVKPKILNKPLIAKCVEEWLISKDMACTAENNEIGVSTLSRYISVHYFGVRPSESTEIITLQSMI